MEPCAAVCENYAEAEARDSARGKKVGTGGEAASPGGGGRVGTLEDEGVFGSSTLLRVLCHREDRNASKYLKSKMHLPKSAPAPGTPTSSWW